MPAAGDVVSAAGLSVGDRLAAVAGLSVGGRGGQGWGEAAARQASSAAFFRAMPSLPS